MAAIDLIPIGSTDDAETTAYQNKLTIRKASDFWAMGGRSAVLDGWGVSTVAGQMQLSVAAGTGVVAARDASQVEQKWGYVAQTRSATIVQFGAASAANRKDALVFAAADPQEPGTFPGTGSLAAGGHLVAVPGVSGTTTARTDAQIAAYIGSGGFHRLADVLIASTDTQIAGGNVTSTRFNANYWNNIPSITAATGFSITYAYYMLYGAMPLARISIWLTRSSGGTISASSVGNLGDTDVCNNMPTFLRAIGNPAYGTFVIPGRILGSARVGTTGNITITDMYPTADIVNGDDLRIDMTYALI